MANDKQININNCIKEDHIVLADQNMFNLIFRNLISNALKFTPQGGQVSVHSESVGDSIRIYVRDSGVGIEPEKIEQLFNADHSKTTRGTSNEKGSGIGLLLCKEFVEKHNSTIIIKSTPGKGSEFSFELPSVN